MMELHDYQRRIVEFCYAHPNCILSVDMGLGKTASVLHFLDKLRPASALIVAPKRVAETVWKQEAEKWGLSIARDMAVVSGTKAKRMKVLSDPLTPIKVIGRDNLTDIGEGAEFGVLVLDELTSFKTPTSKRSRAAQGIRARRKIGLTGTLLANGAIDIFGQAQAVGLSCGTANFYAWRAWHFRDVLQGSGLQFSKWKLVSRLEDVLAPLRKDIFTLTAQDYLTIPQVSEVRHHVQLTDECRRAYEDAKAFLTFDLGGEVMTLKEQQAFGKLQQIANGFVYQNDGSVVRGNGSTKIDDVCEFVERCKAESEAVLLFYAFTAERDWLVEELTKRHISVDEVTKRGFVERWDNGETDVLIAHPASAGHGLNLQHGGRIVVWSSLTYNYELWAQANARLARQGQTRPVQIHVFTADDTIEEAQRVILGNKDKEQCRFLDMTKQ